LVAVFGGVRKRLPGERYVDTDVWRCGTVHQPNRQLSVPDREDLYNTASFLRRKVEAERRLEVSVYAIEHIKNRQ
jgi:hypothetical protein